MLCTTEGIVLHSIKYGDNARILTLYTRDFGRCSLMMQGIHGKKSASKVNLLQPLFLLDLVIDHKKGRDLQRTREVKVHFPYQSIPYQITKTSQVIFLAEVLYKVLREEEANTELYDFLSYSLQILDLMQNGTANFHLSFLVQLARYLGFAPSANYAEERPIFDMMMGTFAPKLPAHPYHFNQEESRILALLAATSYDEIGDIGLSAARRNEILEKLVGYFSLHLGINLQVKSLAVMKELFTEKE